MSQDIIETIKDGVATLTMNRPEARNALSTDMFHGLATALPRLALDKTVRCVVLTGAGSAFCSGGDVKNFARNADSGAPSDFDHRVNDLRMRMEVTRLLHEMAKPTLAVLPGPAAGAGLSLALACDLRIAASTAKMTTAFANVGLSGDFGSSYFLTQMVGAGRARELMFTARILMPDEALALGLLNRVVSAEELPAAAAQFATELASLPTIAVGYMKKNMVIAQRGNLSDTLDAEAIHMLRTFETDDHKDAAKAFVEKRKPTFKGS
ncbi:MAG: enoyl-CoA hydratase [Burkholderiaceae bacterium]